VSVPCAFRKAIHRCGNKLNVTSERQITRRLRLDAGVLGSQRDRGKDLFSGSRVAERGRLKIVSVSRFEHGPKEQPMANGHFSCFRVTTFLVSTEPSCMPFCPSRLKGKRDTKKTRTTWSHILLSELAHNLPGRLQGFELKTRQNITATRPRGAVRGDRRPDYGN
jgi:hypothetical protein